MKSIRLQIRNEIGYCHDYVKKRMSENKIDKPFYNWICMQLGLSDLSMKFRDYYEARQKINELYAGIDQ